MTIVTTAAERPEDIDVQAARRALERAQEELRITEDKFKRMKLETRIQKSFKGKCIKRTLMFYI